MAYALGMPKATRPDDKRLSPRKLNKQMTVRCTADDLVIALAAANRLGYPGYAEAVRDLMAWIATADEEVITAIKARL